MRKSLFTIGLKRYSNLLHCGKEAFFSVPNIYIATDFICAYPTETKSDFEESMALVRKYRFPSLFINQFYSRIGTPAANLKKIDTIEVCFIIFENLPNLVNIKNFFSASGILSRMK